MSRQDRCSGNLEIVSEHQTARTEIVADDRTGSPSLAMELADCRQAHLIVKHLIFLGGATAKRPFATGIGKSVVCRKLVAGLVVGSRCSFLGPKV